MKRIDARTFLAQLQAVSAAGMHWDHQAQQLLLARFLELLSLKLPHLDVQFREFLDLHAADQRTQRIQNPKPAAPLQEPIATPYTFGSRVPRT